MPLIERRTLAGFLVGALTAGVAATAGAAAAFNTTPRAAAPRATASTATTVKACFNKKTGPLVYIGTGSKRRSCKRKTEKALVWNMQGPAGPTAPTDAKGTLHLESDNGQFQIDVSNFGIVLQGPGTSLTVDRQGIHQKAPFGQVVP